MAEKNEETAPAEKPVAKFVGGRAREKTVTLEWPIEFDGVTYEAVTVRRCTGTEVSEFVIARASGEDVLFPGIDCPMPVYEALDADDLEQVDLVVKDFLPRSFQGPAVEPAPGASDNTSTKSDIPSAAVAPK